MIDLDENEVDALASLVGALLAGVGVKAPDDDLLRDLIDDTLDTPDDESEAVRPVDFGAGPAGLPYGLAQILIDAAIAGLEDGDLDDLLKPPKGRPMLERLGAKPRARLAAELAKRSVASASKDDLGARLARIEAALRVG